MLALYWEIGKDIYEQHLDTAYGKHFFEKLSRDLREAFPGIQGFSERNLRYMRAFYAFYHIPILHQPGAELESMLFVIPWRQHVEIFSRAKSFDEAMFFIEKTKQNGWSRAMLINMMDTQIYHSKSGSINNFSITLPSEDSSQANEIIRDQYKLDFLTLHENYKEAELQKSLASRKSTRHHCKRMPISLLIGREMGVEVSEKMNLRNLHRCHFRGDNGSDS